MTKKQAKLWKSSASLRETRLTLRSRPWKN
nr:MAG TPA: hypothetical protein [Caudoviricetes sp.]